MAPRLFFQFLRFRPLHDHGNTLHGPRVRNPFIGNTYEKRGGGGLSLSRRLLNHDWLLPGIAPRHGAPEPLRLRLRLALPVPQMKYRPTTTRRRLARWRHVSRVHWEQTHMLGSPLRCQPIQRTSTLARPPGANSQPAWASNAFALIAKLRFSALGRMLLSMVELTMPSRFPLRSYTGPPLFPGSPERKSAENCFGSGNDAGAEGEFQTLGMPMTRISSPSNGAATGCTKLVLPEWRGIQTRARSRSWCLAITSAPDQTPDSREIMARGLLATFQSAVPMTWRAVANKYPAGVACSKAPAPKLMESTSRLPNQVCAAGEITATRLFQLRRGIRAGHGCRRGQDRIVGAFVQVRQSVTHSDGKRPDREGHDHAKRGEKFR